LRESAPPMPSSRISSRRVASWVSTPTFTSEAAACLAALVSAPESPAQFSTGADIHQALERANPEADAHPQCTVAPNMRWSG
jgi:hypothetical protein